MSKVKDDDDGPQKCESCGEANPDVRYTENPYDYEFHREVRMIWICRDCLRRECEDI